MDESFPGRNGNFNNPENVSRLRIIEIRGTMKERRLMSMVNNCKEYFENIHIL